MDIYTLLLVDDEEDVIQVIMKKINWENLGFSVVGYATNGVKALELVEEFQPDVVMTDIRMPYMDGMELSHHIKTEFPATKILLFTGFDEFEYAKEAVHLEVEEYILKPVNSIELIRVFTRLKEKLDQEISERQNVKILQQYYLKSLPLLQANFYATLIEGKVPADEISRYLRDYQVSFTGPYFCCLIVHTSSSRTPKNMNPLLLSSSVQKQAEERLGKRWQAKCFSYLGDTILFAQLAGTGEITELTDECDRFCRYANRMIGAVVTVGIGQVCSRILELSQSYHSAREAVSYRAIYGVSRAINIKEIVPRKTSRPGSDGEAELSQLIKTIYLNSREDMVKAVDRYLRRIFYAEKSLQLHYIDIMDLVSALCRFAMNHGIAPEERLGDIRQLFGRLFDLEAEELKTWLITACMSLQEDLSGARSRSTNSFVLQAKAFIHNHYADETFSLDSVSQALGVSNSYLSTIFKKATGHSLVGYLTEYRMERASRLLLETNEKSYVIAGRVGYSDPNYFSYVFKRKFGVSPSKYRTEQLRSGE